ncbi:type IV pilin protein [Dyella subtropica]|uniref:type IV pilin protein n=1 Tax=Dyella subtropica TaxID=2992127 RepID=UPI003CE4E3BB
MIVVAIVAILAAIALPSYRKYVLHGNRSAAEQVMLDMSAAQERYMIDNRSYAASASSLGYAVMPDTVSPNYTMAVATNSGPPPSFNITATPINSQTGDTDCNVLTLTSSGSKSASGSSTKCWK